MCVRERVRVRVCARVRVCVYTMRLLRSLTLREERRLRVFENRILKPIIAPKRDVNGEWRRLHNEELHNL